MHKLITVTATATRAMSIGMEDRADRELQYVQKALTLLTKVLCEEDREGHELVTVEDVVNNVKDMDLKDEEDETASEAV